MVLLCKTYTKMLMNFLQKLSKQCKQFSKVFIAIPYVYSGLRDIMTVQLRHRRSSVVSKQIKQDKTNFVKIKNVKDYERTI